MKKIKLDENFPPSCVSIFADKGFDASSVLHQALSGTHDDNLYTICKEEDRILVTFDLDFANIIRYPAEQTKGILVYRIRKRMVLEEIMKACTLIADVLTSNATDSSLLIIDGDRLRIRKPEDI